MSDTTAEKVVDLAKDIHVSMLTTVDGEGHFVSRPMGQQHIEPDGTVWFFAERDSRKAWMPQGPNDPSVVLIEVNGDTAEYWDTPGGRIATAISFAKAKLTGRRFDGGENETVRLR